MLARRTPIRALLVLLVPVLLLCLLVGPATTLREAWAHTVETVDGRVLEGKIVLENDEVVVIVTTFDGRISVPRAEVKTVDRTALPLREQFAFRAERAVDDVSALWDLHGWAGKHGFEPESVQVLERILQLAPKNAKAHKLLGHEKVDGQWMTPEEKEAHLLALEEAEMRAQGLVRYEDRWVTPEEKEALEQGLRKDGDEWVTDEEYHRRRGEQLVDGEWVRIGEEEGKAWQRTLTEGRVKSAYLWSPSVDLFHGTDAEVASKVAEGAEAAMRVFRRVFAPTPEEYPTGPEGRPRLHLFNKIAPYARFVKFFDETEKCSDLIPGWQASVRRQHSFWWVQPVGTVGAFKFPNTTRTFTSNAVHSMGLILLTRYRFNFRFPHRWLSEGFAYYLEMEGYGYSDTFSVAKGGTVAAGAAGKPAWLDSDQWRAALKALVAEGRDAPLKRMDRMDHDQMGYPELVKSWSLVEFLIKTDAEKFRAFIAADKDRANTTEDALKIAYGWTLRTLDRQWRAYVGAGFVIP